MGEYNKVVKDDNIAVINAKLKTDEYAGLSDWEILVKLNEAKIFVTAPFEVENGQIVRKY